MNKNQINNFINDIKNTIYFKNIITNFNPISIFLGGSVSENLDTDSSDIDIFVLIKDDLYTAKDLHKFYNNFLMIWNGFEVHFIFKTLSTYLNTTSLANITGYGKQNIHIYGKEKNNTQLNIIYGSFLLTHDDIVIDLIKKVFLNEFDNKTPNHYVYGIILIFCKFLNINIDKKELLNFKNRTVLTFKEKELFKKIWHKVKNKFSDDNIDIEKIRKEIEKENYDLLLL